MIHILQHIEIHITIENRLKYLDRRRAGVLVFYTDSMLLVMNEALTIRKFYYEFMWVSVFFYTLRGSCNACPAGAADFIR